MVVNQYDIKEIIPILEKRDFLAPSYFWQKGHFIFLEIIFWSLFGVIANVLYSVSESYSKPYPNAKPTDGLNRAKIPIHVAKLIYAPISTVVIFLSAELLISSGKIVIDQISYWGIVLAFMLGYFSGRTVDLLNHIKDILLPLGKDKKVETVSIGKPTKPEKKGNIAVGNEKKESSANNVEEAVENSELTSSQSPVQSKEVITLPTKK